MDILSSWYNSKEQLESDVADFIQAKEDHKLTVGVPAPLPPNILVDNIVNSGGEFNWIEPEESEPELPPLPEPTVQQRRMWRYREETDPLFMKACEDYTVGSTQWNDAITAWKGAKESIRLEIPYE